jgi:hypothetical protein
MFPSRASTFTHCWFWSFIHATADFNTISQPTGPKVLAPSHNIIADSTDQQDQARVQELYHLVNNELHTHVLLLHGIINRNPYWQNQPFEVQSRQQEELWVRQTQSFEQGFVRAHKIDPQALLANRGRFTDTPISRQRHLLEIQMRRENGLPEGQLSMRECLRLGRMVMEAQLRTLQEWGRVWRARVLPEYQQATEQGGNGSGRRGGGDAATISQGVSAGEMERIQAYEDLI